MVSLPLRHVADVPMDGETVVSFSRKAGPTSPPHCPIWTRVRILVVDDEPDSRRVLVRVLGRAHAEVREADSVAEALKVLAGWPPDILISDIAHARRRWL